MLLIILMFNTLSQLSVDQAEPTHTQAKWAWPSAVSKLTVSESTVDSWMSDNKRVCPCGPQRLKPMSKTNEHLIHGTRDTPGRGDTYHQRTGHWLLTILKTRTCHGSIWLALRCVRLIYPCSLTVGPGQVWMTHTAFQVRLLRQSALHTHREAHQEVRGGGSQAWILTLLTIHLSCAQYSDSLNFNFLPLSIQERILMRSHMEITQEATQGLAGESLHRKETV